MANLFVRFALLGALVIGIGAGGATMSQAQRAPDALDAFAPQTDVVSPLLGRMPPLPLRRARAQKVQKNPALLPILQSQLAPVGTAPLAAVDPFTPRGGFNPGGRPQSEPPVGSGGWVSGTRPPGNPVLSNPLVLMDGSVIAHVSCTGIWWKLTPDRFGNYSTGSWTQIASLPSGYTPRFFASAVLPDGRVIVEGGEYNVNCAAAWTNLGAIYDPQANTWTPVAPPTGWTRIGDAQSTVLPDGRFMVANCCTTQSAILDPTTLTWTLTGSGKFDENDEEGWTLLPNNKVLTVDAYVGKGGCGVNSELYDPVVGTWSLAGVVPAQLADCSNPTNTPSFEMGPQVLRPDGTVGVFGGTTCWDGTGSVDVRCTNGTFVVTTHSAIYNTAANSWTSGPDIPAVGGVNYTLADAPATLLPNGNILFAASPNQQAFARPTHFFEMGAAPTNTITQVSDPSSAGNLTSFQWNFVMLPNGMIMAMETDGSNVWYYTTAAFFGSPSAPTISSVPSRLYPGETNTLAGTQLNGLAQGSNYGDDQSAATNYPIITLQNPTTQATYYARTFNPTSMSVTPGQASQVNFTLPAGIPPGPYTLAVGANGNYSNGTVVNVGWTWTTASTGDANGDTPKPKSDIFWRNAAGDTVVSLMNGPSIVSSTYIATLPTTWTLVGTGDFNGDGKADILWRDSTNGNAVVSLMNGGAITSSTFIANLPTSWSVAGIGDFDGTGKAGILWRNTNGDTVVSLMNGASIASSTFIGNVPPNWTVAGIGDFNGDGKADILWRAPNGDTVISLMNGAAITSSAFVVSLPPSWSVAGVGDFNGDGKADILWRNANGDAVISLMNGASIASSTFIANLPMSWSVASIGDFDGDGKADILWRNSNGSTVLSQMNGASITASTFVVSLP